MRLLIGVLVWLSCLAACNPPASQGQNEPNPQQASAKALQETTKAVAPVAKPSKSADERLATYTFWLTVFTGLLFGVSAFQGYYIRKADKTATLTAQAASNSANAASDSVAIARQAQADTADTRRIMADQHKAMADSAEAARALAYSAVASERAFVFLDTTKTQADPTNAPIAPRPVRAFNLYFINLGKTPAQVDSMEIAYGAWGPEEIRALPKHPRGEEKPLGFWLGLNASSDPPDAPLRVMISEEAAQRAHFGEDVVAILGRVRFRDVFGGRRETGFAIALSKGGPPYFTTIPNTNLNYTGDEKQ